MVGDMYRVRIKDGAVVWKARRFHRRRMVAILAYYTTAATRVHALLFHKGAQGGG